MGPEWQTGQRNRRRGGATSRLEKKKGCPRKGDGNPERKKLGNMALRKKMAAAVTGKRRAMLPGEGLSRGRAGCF